MEQAAPPIPAALLAALSHELRTPLSAILGFSDAMRARAFGPLSDQYAEHAGLIHDAGRHMLDLIETMTGAAAASAQNTVRRLDIRQILREAARMVPTDDAALILDLPAEPLMIAADALAVRQIVINLLTNARRASAGGGRVTLSAQPIDDRIEVRVEDDGPGLPAHDAPASGQGLGLTLSRALCLAQGAELVLLTAPGAGVTAIVRFAPARET